MTVFKVGLHGTGFQMTIDGQLGTFGFYTIRCVEQNNRQSAEAAAIEAVLERAELRRQVLRTESPASIAAETVDECTDGTPAVQGLAWYKMT